MISHERCFLHIFLGMFFSRLSSRVSIQSKQQQSELRGHHHLPSPSRTLAALVFTEHCALCNLTGVPPPFSSICRCQPCRRHHWPLLPPTAPSIAGAIGPPLAFANQRKPNNQFCLIHREKGQYVTSFGGFDEMPPNTLQRIKYHTIFYFQNILPL